MKNTRLQPGFGSSPSRRRGGRFPFLPVLIALVVVSGLAFLWHRGGEVPQSRVERDIPVERLGKG